MTFLVTPSQLGRKVYPITATAEYEGRRYQEGYQLTGYAGLRPYFLYRPATYKTSGVDVKIAPELRVAYVMGSGDEVPASLEHLGVKVTSLSAADVVSGDLSRFDVVLLGVAPMPRVRIECVEQPAAGVCAAGRRHDRAVQHARVRSQLRSVPLRNGAEPGGGDGRSIESGDPAGAPVVRLAEQDHREGFRGMGGRTRVEVDEIVDAHYEALLETHDADQPPQKGGLLYAKYGKGVYIYNAYAFYRQLPEVWTGHTGSSPTC